MVTKNICVLWTNGGRMHSPNQLYSICIQLNILQEKVDIHNPQKPSRTQATWSLGVCYYLSIF